MLNQHLNSKKHKKMEKETMKMKNSFSTDDGSHSLNKISENNSDNPYEEFENKTLTEESKIEEPRQTSMDSLRI